MNAIVLHALFLCEYDRGLFMPLMLMVLWMCCYRMGVHQRQSGDLSPRRVRIHQSNTLPLGTRLLMSCLLMSCVRVSCVTSMIDYWSSGHTLHGLLRQRITAPWYAGSVLACDVGSSQLLFDPQERVVMEPQVVVPARLLQLVERDTANYLQERTKVRSAGQPNSSLD